VLVYDSGEDFHALNPAAATDFFQHPGSPDDSNQLKDAGGPFATANPLWADILGQGRLSIQTLAAEYPQGSGRRSGSLAAGSDFISERGNGQGPLNLGFSSSGYSSDAAQMEARPGYANVVYGRVFHGASGEVWLQYWIYYYFDSQGNFGGAVHEGDWELVQVRLDAAGSPDQAAYAQHGSGERCAWSQVASTAGRPLVYVAQGSHASYFRPGHYDDPDPDDDANGEGPYTLPAVEQIRSESPSWVAWPGAWGDSQTSDGQRSSPPGPRFQSEGKWTDPAGWASGLRSCDGS
jgi:hypothetical protein